MAIQLFTSSELVSTQRSAGSKMAQHHYLNLLIKFTHFPTMEMYTDPECDTPM